MKFAGLSCLASCLLPSLLGACSGLDTGNAETTTVTFALSVDPVPPVESSGVEMGFTRAYATIRHIELYLPSGASCAGLDGLDTIDGDYTVVCDGDKIRARGPWSIDLLTRVATPALPDVRAPVGTYRRVDVRLTKDANGTTIGVEGNFPVGGVPTPYSLAMDFEDDLRFEGSAIVGVADAVAQALLKLDPSAWFATMPIAQCLVTGDLQVEDGLIELDDGDGACDDLEEVVEAAVSGSGQLEDDDDDD